MGYNVEQDHYFTLEVNSKKAAYVTYNFHYFRLPSQLKTIKHSSSMRTAPLLTEKWDGAVQGGTVHRMVISGGGAVHAGGWCCLWDGAVDRVVLSGGGAVQGEECCLQGGAVWRMVLSITGSDIIAAPSPWTEWLTDRCKNITLPQTSFTGGKTLRNIGPKM